MEESLSDNRMLFEIELKYGETTIVSWVQLLKDSGIPVDHSPCSSPEAQKQLHEEDDSRSTCSNVILKKEKDEYTYRSPTIEHCRPKKPTTVPEATKNTKIGHSRVRSVALTSNKREPHSLDNGRFELPDLKHALYSAGSTRRLHGDFEDAVGTKSRLPRELKKKLETVARLARSTHGRIPDELRWLRDMVPSEISACGGDAIRFSQIKSKVIEMIKLRNPSRDGSDKEIIELHGAPKAKFNMDHEMEDKICDFSDVYVQGMDEIKSSDIRKFYIQDHETSKRKTLEFDEDLHGKVKLVAAMVNDTNAPVSTFPDTTVPGTPELNQNLSTPAKRFSPSSPAPASNRLSKTA